MGATIEVTLRPLILPLVGVQAIEVLVDNEVAAEIGFGQATTFEVAPGHHQIALRLQSVISRTSNSLPVDLGESQRALFIGNYSRTIWVRTSGVMRSNFL